MLENTKIYITHYSKLEERKKYITEIFNKEEISNYTFYQEFDKEVVTPELDTLNYDYNIEQIFQRISSFIPHTIILQFLNDRLNMPEKSLGLKHKNIYKDFLENSTEDYLLIFEDDVRFVNNFKIKLNFFMKNVPEDFNFLLLGAGASIKNTEFDQHLFGDTTSNCGFVNNNIHPFSHGSDAYLVNRKTVALIYEYLCNNKMVVPIDWELSSFAKLNNMKTLICYPYLTYQGSAGGNYNSSVRERKDLYG